jgi:predicted metal-dependent hydrolase
MFKFNGQELTEEQKTAKQISAMDDSVWLINKLIAEGTHNEQVHDDISRNVEHLTLMVSKDIIKNSGTDLSGFNTAIADGTVFIS